MHGLSFLKVLSVLLLGAGVAFGAVAEVVDKGDWVVTGDETVGEDGVTCNSITFNASAKISGGPITLGSGGITVASGVKGAVITSAIAGTEAFTVQGAGAANSEISFKGANTFSGEMTIKSVKFHAYHNQTFGTQEAKTYFRSPATSGADHAELWFHGIETYEPFETYYTSSGQKEFCWAEKTTNVLHGVVANTKERVEFYAANQAYTVLSNDWTGLGYTDNIGSSSTAHWEVYGQLKGMNRIEFLQGTWVLHQRLGPYGSGRYGSQISSGGTLVSATTNIFAASDTATTTKGYNANLWGYGTWDLNGYDQRLNQFQKNGGDAHATKVTVTSAKPATLYYEGMVWKGSNLDQVDTLYDQTLEGTIAGQVSLVVGGSKTLTLEAPCTTIGDLLVTNTATLAFGSVGSWAGTNITVASGAQLLTTASANLPDYIKVRLGETGKLNLTGAFVAHELWTNGVKVASNTSYGSSESSANVKDDDHFAGTGVLTVLAEAVPERIWIGGAEDDLLTTAANWLDGQMPDFTDGLAKPRFAQSGARAVVPTAETPLRLGAVIFAAGDETPRFGLEPQNASTTFKIASLTCDDADLTSERQYTNAVPTILEAAQGWNLPSAKTTFHQTAPLSSPFDVNWVVSGPGSLYLWSAADGLTGTFTLQSGALHLKNPAAFGEMNLVTIMKSSTTKMNFYGGVISNNVTLAGDDSSGCLIFNANTTTEFAGTFDWNGYDRGSYRSGSKVIYSGGLTYCNSVRVGFTHVVYTNKPCALPSFDGAGNKIEIWSTNNTFRAYGDDGTFAFGNRDDKSPTHVELHAPYALSTNWISKTLYPWITGYANIVYSLFGCDQQIVRIQDADSITSGKSWTITSDKPAQMKIYQNADKTVSHLLVTGAAGLTLNGPNALTLTGRTCTTTGALEVEDGTLTLGADESFPNVRTVRVSGGTLALTSVGQLDRRVNLYVSGSGKISIPDGVTLEVRRLYVNGQSQKMGDYSTGEYITGGGKVHVPGGAAIILR